MADPISNRDLVQALLAAGIQLPPECVNISVEIPPDGVVQVVYRCNVTDEHMHAVGAALQALAVGKRLDP